MSEEPLKPISDETYSHATYLYLKAIEENLTALETIYERDDRITYAINTARYNVDEIRRLSKEREWRK